MLEQLVYRDQQLRPLQLVHRGQRWREQALNHLALHHPTHFRLEQQGLQVELLEYQHPQAEQRYPQEVLHCRLVPQYLDRWWMICLFPNRSILRQIHVQRFRFECQR
jgi:hypothetical protein